MRFVLLLAGLLSVLGIGGTASLKASDERRPDFKEFDRKAKAGERLNVVFFGASLTWGANASDPLLTSYRAQISRRLEKEYPEARFTFWDGAIGGTGSQLGVFRFDREVVRHNPDLIFLDFSANDDIGSYDEETLASYESLVRRALLEAHAPLVQVIFPFQWNIPASLESMKRRTAHREIAQAYNVPIGDAIELIQQRVKSGEVKIEEVWPFDGVHPGDKGYTQFADAAWTAFKQGVGEGRVCAAPEKMLHPDYYMKYARIKFSTLGELPAGWHVGMPNPNSPCFDFTMSRWLDDETIASNRKDVMEDGKKKSVPQDVARMKLKVQARAVFFFGESTTKSCKYKVYVDGKVLEYSPGGKKEPTTIFDAADFGKRLNGNGHYFQKVTIALDPAVEHTVEIEPNFEADKDQELRLESICVAGGEATVKLDR